MKVGVFTPLLSGLPLDAVLKKLTDIGIDTVELGTGGIIVALVAGAFFFHSFESKRVDIRSQIEAKETGNTIQIANVADVLQAQHVSTPAR